MQQALLSAPALESALPPQQTRMQPRQSWPRVNGSQGPPRAQDGHSLQAATPAVIETCTASCCGSDQLHSGTLAFSGEAAEDDRLITGDISPEQLAAFIDPSDPMPEIPAGVHETEIDAASLCEYVSAATALSAGECQKLSESCY